MFKLRCACYKYKHGANTLKRQWWCRKHILCITTYRSFSARHPRERHPRMCLEALKDQTNRRKKNNYEFFYIGVQHGNYGKMVNWAIWIKPGHGWWSVQTLFDANWYLRRLVAVSISSFRSLFSYTFFFYL